MANIGSMDDMYLIGVQFVHPPGDLARQVNGVPLVGLGGTFISVNILVREYRCSGGTETAKPEQGYRT